MIKRILIVALLLAVDLAVFVFLGLLMMNYEDFYMPEDGPWYSFQSMSSQEIFIWFAYQGWFVINVFILIYFIYRWIKKIRTTTSRKQFDT